ncbi:MAG: PhoH family protein [bacterium]
MTVIDTNVLIDNPSILYEYKDIVIPYVILEELDNLKNRDDIGKNAREVTRILIKENIKCKNFGYKKGKIDDFLLELGHKIITQDMLMYLKGKAKGVDIKLYERNKDIYLGIIQKPIPPKKVDELYNKGKIKIDMELYENQFLDAGNVIARYKEGYLHRVDWDKRLIDGSKLNRRQIMFEDLLTDGSITVVCCIGEQGTGKTTIAIENAIKQLDKGVYERCVLIRPLINKGGKWEDVGFLPGSKEEKIHPFLQPFWDNLKNKTQKIDRFEMESIGFLQGRNFENTLIIITEAENIHPGEMEGIISRVGKGSKLILEGDHNQCNRSDLNPYFNGLVHTINTFKNEKMVGSILLDKIERSETAKIAKKLRM